MPNPTVTRAEISHIEIRFEKPLGGSGVRGVDLIVADLTDSDGAEGVGFTYVIGGNGGLTARAAAEQAERFLRGQPLRHPVAAWREIAKSFNRTGDGPNMVALATLDVALWDLTAKRQGLPLGIAMGGGDRATPVYGSGGFSPGMEPAAAVDMAQAQVAQGFRGVKPRVNAQGADAALMQKVRGAIPDHIAFMVDANEKGDLPRAQRLLAAAADNGVLFVEEPLPATEVLGYRLLAATAACPIAHGEHLQGLDRFAVALADRTASVIQPDLAMAGGLTPCLQVAQLAQGAGVSVAPHFLPGLFVHLAAASSAVTWLEDFPLVEPYLEGWPEMRDGMLSLPDRPGHGLTVPASTRRLASKGA